MLKPTNVLIILILILSGYWFYSNLTTPQSDSAVRVTNLPWQITVVDPYTLHVFDLDIGKANLAQAVNTLKSEYELAWFDNPDQSISLEAYFFRVSLSGLRAKVILELDAAGLDREYLQKNSGKPQILTSRAIKYPLDDLARVLNDRMIRSLTYVPKSSIDPELIKSRFGLAEEIVRVNDTMNFWLYPQKGLVIAIDKKGKEAFQYVPVADFERLKKTVMATAEQAQQPAKN
ncbi:MAG: hypothetical protein QNL62_20135 [Gammaproteobacteria bacterium]|nr:hypothetical protein [Gammaproteobacteria bacterium]